MKRVGYPEDSTQSAYSSQLIRIPLSAIIFYLSCFISREATTRQCWGSDQNQLLGGLDASRHARTHTFVPHFRLENDAVCIRYDDECFTGSVHLSVDANFQCFLSLCLFPPLSGPPVHLASVEVTESSYCLARHTNELPLNSLLARLPLLIAQRKEEAMRDGVRPWGEKVVIVTFYEICLHRVLKLLKEACSYKFIHAQ